MRRLVFALFMVLMGCGNSETQKQRFLIRGNEAFQQHNYRDAIRFFKEAIALDSCFTAAINNLGITYFELGHYEKAVIEYGNVLTCDPNHLEAYMNRSNAFYELNELYRALDDLEFVRQNIPDSSTVYFRMGLVKAKMRAFEESIQAFDKALALDSTNEETLINRGTIKYYMNDLKAAEEDLRKALQKNPRQANAYNALALIAVAQERYNEALLQVNKALELEPGQPYFLNNRGFIYLMKDELDRAKADIDRSITIDPNNGWAYRNKGWYYYKTEEYQDAIRLLERAVELDPFVDKGYLFLGQAYLRNGENNKACTALREAKTNGTVVPDELLDSCH